jgi:two-component system, chemotaxis family, chemotaxis protein CheY
MTMLFFIVEDEPEIVEFYVDVIELYGHTVLETSDNGADAVEKYSHFKTRPDVTIMDHRMFVMNGLDATKEILKIDPQAKIIFASADQSVEPGARQLGVVSFLKKPFSVDGLLKIIRMIEQQLTHGKADSIPAQSA